MFMLNWPPNLGMIFKFENALNFLIYTEVYIESKRKNNLLGQDPSMPSRNFLISYETGILSEL
jgi:hypothetical protein